MTTPLHFASESPPPPDKRKISSYTPKLRVTGALDAEIFGSCELFKPSLAGCARDVGEQYVGKWVNVKSQKNVLSIKHNGESFIIRDTTPELFGSGVKTKSHPAILRRAAGVQR